MSGLSILLKRIKDNKLFTGTRADFLHCFKDTFEAEIRYLKSAYVVKSHPPQSKFQLAPSEVLFDERFEEIDRTFTGLVALYWIYHRDYDNFTRNQPTSGQLSKVSFRRLCDFFAGELDNFQNSEKLVLLITLQVTNDLGKSAELKEEFDRLRPGNSNVNHDMLLHQVMTYHPELIPSIDSSDQKSLLCELVHLASEHNPGQLMQGESPPALLDVLHNTKISAADLRLKYMEVFLDVSGAHGNINHDGAMTMTEAVFQGYNHACRISQYILHGGDTEVAWKDMLHVRLQILKQGQWQGVEKLDPDSDPQHRAKVRLLSMARASYFQVADAIVYAFDEVLDNTTQQLLTEGLNKYGTVQDPAVLPTYMPEMIGLILRRTITSTSVTRGEALAAAMKYLARVLSLSKEDREQLEEGVVVVERDVMDILEPIIGSENFVELPSFALNLDTELPKVQVVRKVQVQKQVTQVKEVKPSHKGHHRNLSIRSKPDD